MDKYSSRTVWIHWLSAILIVGLIFSGINMEHNHNIAEKFKIYKIHFALGLIVFVLTGIRTIALFKDTRPKELNVRKFHLRFVKVVHYGFYVIIMWMCISGSSSLIIENLYPAIINNNINELPEIGANGMSFMMISHHILAKFVFLLLIFHVVGFIIHLIRKRENTLKRIWFK